MWEWISVRIAVIRHHDMKAYYYATPWTPDPRYGVTSTLCVLTPKQKEILLMRESGLTFSDIARRLNLSRGAVLGRLSRARKAIAQCC
jgi:DNA-directed RNA polymerase specialized sigma24 family protein